MDPMNLSQKVSYWTVRWSVSQPASESVSQSVSQTDGQEGVTGQSSEEWSLLCRASDRVSDNCGRIILIYSGCKLLEQ
jgi:hypothetical protein